jgi:hypothetical protein
MKAITPNNANYCYRAPKGVDNCADLNVHVYDDGDVRIITSVWQPTEEERALLIAGEPVQLHVYGSGHPVVSLTVAKPHVHAG